LFPHLVKLLLSSEVKLHVDSKLNKALQVKVEPKNIVLLWVYGRWAFFWLTHSARNIYHT